MSAAPTTTLPTREAEAIPRYVNDIFDKAVYHDREIERVKGVIDDLLVVDKTKRTGGGLDQDLVFYLEDYLDKFRSEITRVCATLAAGAVRRAIAIAEATGGEYGQIIFDMDRGKSERYARELFEEAGIPERFVE